MSMSKKVILKLFFKNKFNKFLNANTDPSIAVNRYQKFITKTLITIHTFDEYVNRVTQTRRVIIVTFTRFIILLVVLRYGISVLYSTGRPKYGYTTLISIYFNTVLFILSIYSLNCSWIVRVLFDI